MGFPQPPPMPKLPPDYKSDHQLSVELNDEIRAIRKALEMLVMLYEARS